MIVHFDNVSRTRSRTGPNTFAARLAYGLEELGHRVQYSAIGADVSLVFIERSGAPVAGKVVQRLDGTWSKPLEFARKNVGIERTYLSADAVVFQSEFDRRFVEHHWGKHRDATVVRNGAPTVNRMNDAVLDDWRRNYDLIFVSSANWHPQKRLRSNVELFTRLREVTGKRCCLIVLGNDPDHFVYDSDVCYAGSVDFNTYMNVYLHADWMIHLAWRDHCPNTCVECLAQGTPVICSADGGTVELVGGYGLALDEDVQNDLAPFDYDHPPEIDVSQVTKLPSLDGVERPNVSIERCVDGYAAVLERCLCTPSLTVPMITQ